MVVSRGAKPRGSNDLPAPVDYGKANIVLFGQRKELLGRLAVTGAEDASQSGHRNAIRDRVLRDVKNLDTQIVELNKALVRDCTRRFTSRSSPTNRADIEQAGYLGLLKAIQKFDADVGGFRNWAKPYILKEVVEAVRSIDHQMMSPSDFGHRNDVTSATARVQRTIGSHVPTDYQVAHIAQMPIARVGRVRRPAVVVSLDEQLGPENCQDLEDTLESVEPLVEEDVLFGMETPDDIVRAVTALTARELMVYWLRREHIDAPRHSLTSVANMLGVSRETIRKSGVTGQAKIEALFRRDSS